MRARPRFPRPSWRRSPNTHAPAGHGEVRLRVAAADARAPGCRAVRGPRRSRRVWWCWRFPVPRWRRLRPTSCPRPRRAWRTTSSVSGGFPPRAPRIPRTASRPPRPPPARPRLLRPPRRPGARARLGPRRLLRRAAPRARIRARARTARPPPARARPLPRPVHRIRPGPSNTGTLRDRPRHRTARRVEARALTCTGNTPGSRRACPSRARCPGSACRRAGRAAPTSTESRQRSGARAAARPTGSATRA